MPTHLLLDTWNGLITRTTGPLKFRFVLQPLMATFLAVRDGLRDSRTGKPPFFWDFCEDPAQRKALMKDCWKSVGKILILAFVLDCIYQVIEVRWIYVIDALLIAIFLAIIPYVLVRGPVDRIATARKPPQTSSANKNSNEPPSLKKAV